MNEPQAPAPEEGGEDPMAALGAIQDAMMSLMQGAKEMPPEAAQALQAATQAYSQFLEIVTGAPQGGEPTQSSPNGATQMGGGNPNARAVV